MAGLTLATRCCRTGIGRETACNMNYRMAHSGRDAAEKRSVVGLRVSGRHGALGSTKEPLWSTDRPWIGL